MRKPLALTQNYAQRRKYAVAVEETNKGVDPNDSFLSGNTANYVDAMYMAWKDDPSSVHLSWQVYFRNMESGDMPMSRAFQAPPTIVSSGDESYPWAFRFCRYISIFFSRQSRWQPSQSSALVRAYQARGHHKARLDPLGIRIEAEQFGYSKAKELELETYGFDEATMQDGVLNLDPASFLDLKLKGAQK